MAISTTANAAAPDNPLLHGPILPRLIGFALPNMGAMVAGSVAAIAETAYVGQLGVPALAGMAVVFPIVMLQGMLSAGAMGSGVSAAIARALGSGDRPQAEALAVHALWISVIAGVITTFVIELFAPSLFALLGARGAALAQAVIYARVAFLGAIAVWLVNLLAAVLRGAGSMKAPSAILLLTAVAQVVIGGVCGLGLGPIPRFGMAGVAAGQVAASAIGAALLIVQLRSGRAAVTLALGSVRPQAALFGAILRTGATAAVSPLMAIAAIILLNRLVSGYGPTVLAGFGIGTRLEFLLTPLSFAIGVASVPLVGTAIGAGMVARARAAAWIAGGLAAATMATIGIILGLFPVLWVGMFTSDPETLAAASDYFHWVGPAYGFFGAGMSLFFSALAAGRVVGMLLAGASRLLVIMLGGLALVPLAAPLWMVFALITVAMATYGSMAMLVMARSKWGMESTPR